jgi:hypothetical protein
VEQVVKIGEAESEILACWVGQQNLEKRVQKGLDAKGAKPENVVYFI